MKIYVVRVLEVDYNGDNFWYEKIETKEFYGPFPSLPSMLGHMHDKLLEEIGEAITRQAH